MIPNKGKVYTGLSLIMCNLVERFCHSEAVIIGFILAIWIVAVTPPSVIAVTQWSITRGFILRNCSGTHVHDTKVTPGIEFVHAIAKTCLLENGLCEKEVELYFPPIDPVLAGLKQPAADAWIAAISSTNSFVCYIDDPDSPGMSYGITATHEKMLIWFILLTINCTIVATLLVLGCRELANRCRNHIKRKPVVDV